MSEASVPVFYDCEASELDEGYIIEIGWAFSDGEGFVSAGSLIRPLAAWNIDDAWSSEAEALHSAIVRKEAWTLESVRHIHAGGLQIIQQLPGIIHQGRIRAHRQRRPQGSCRHPCRNRRQQPRRALQQGFRT